MSDYEKRREERIKENINRMQKLGIFDLSIKLKSVKPIRKNNTFKTINKTASLSSPLPVRLPDPVRRSSRLQSTAPVSYAELHPEKEGKPSKRNVIYYTEGSRPEEYTEEHEKLLGNTEMTWTLFVDGYGKDGKRIYDSVKGKTCHQCRQKTLGHRTQCSNCGMVQGQFCGDCLYMRYGENVLEANQNPEWTCPVCRGICNCSLCRQAKGWAPTGTLYKKVTQLGFKSVAHYLIQTRRPQADSADTKPTTEEAKDLKPTTEEVDDLEQNAEEFKAKKESAEEIHDIEPTTEEVKECLVPNNNDSDIEPPTEEVKESLVPNNDDSKYAVVSEIDEMLGNKVPFPENKHSLGNSEANQNKDDNELKGKEVKKDEFVKLENANEAVAVETRRMSKRRNNTETGGDSIAHRLRQRRRLGN